MYKKKSALRNLHMPLFSNAITYTIHLTLSELLMCSASWSRFPSDPDLAILWQSNAATFMAWQKNGLNNSLYACHSTNSNNYIRAWLLLLRMFISVAPVDRFSWPKTERMLVHTTNNGLITCLQELQWRTLNRVYKLLYDKALYSRAVKRLVRQLVWHYNAIAGSSHRKMKKKLGHQSNDDAQPSPPERFWSVY